MLASVAIRRASAEHLLPISSRLEVACCVVGSRIYIRSVLCALLSAQVRQLVRALIGIDAHVCGHPLDADGDGEVAEQKAQFACEKWVGFGFPTFG